MTYFIGKDKAALMIGMDQWKLEKWIADLAKKIL